MAKARVNRCDADGFTSAAAIINYLNKLFPAYVNNCLIYKCHSGKQHGIEMDMIDEDIKLVICPDSASSDKNQWLELEQRGVDVLILDHHESSINLLPQNVTRINNQTCYYPNKTLSGVGIVYKFCQYLDRLMGTNHSDSLLDLVAVGLISDMMLLSSYETLYYVREGLRRLSISFEDNQNPFLKTMIGVQEYSITKHGALDPFTVSFYITPFINAVIRVGTMEDKIKLFESMLDTKGRMEVPSTKRGCKGQLETLAEQACREATNIKRHQQQIRDNTLETIIEIIESQFLCINKILAIKLPKDLEINKSVLGLIANQIVNIYQQPTLLLNETENSWEGSVRNYSRCQLTNLKDYLEKCPGVNWCAG